MPTVAAIRLILAFDDHLAPRENWETVPVSIDSNCVHCKRFDGSLDYYKALLRTIWREQFIDEHMGISKEKYSAYIEELEGAGYIKKWNRTQEYQDIF